MNLTRPARPGTRYRMFFNVEQRVRVNVTRPVCARWAIDWAVGCW
ncbi:hypothetical protein ABIB54_000226 [Frigoribacterium sp. UYMn621]